MSLDKGAARARLEAQRDDLARRVERLQAAERDETARSGNVGGETDNAHEWENAEIREGEIEEALDELRQTEAALARLEGGEYGVCAVCGSPIEPERLAPPTFRTRSLTRTGVQSHHERSRSRL